MSKPKRPAKKTRSSTGPKPPIAIAITSEQRERAEKIWAGHNRVQPVRASKSNVYRNIFDAGLHVWEKELSAHAT